MTDLNPWQTATDSMSRSSGAGANLADVLERVLDKGMVIAGDIQINLLDIELLTIKLRLLVASVDKAKEMGIDWWEHDPALSSRAARAQRRERAAASADPRAGGQRNGDRKRALPMSELDRDATYTYAVARQFDPARIAGLRGVDGAPVRLIGHRNVVAVVSTATPEGLDEVSLSARLEQLDELEMIARSHDAVVAAVCAHTVALPFRLATIHRGESSVIEMLRREYDELVARLDRLSGRVELGVKVYAESASPACQPRGIADGPIGSSPTETSGRQYLQRRKDQQRSRDTAWQLSAAAAARADAELSKLAVASRHHRPHHGQLCPDRGDNVLNAAYLVEVGLVDRFTAKVRDLDRVLLGARIDVTGPWAPYSFVHDDDQ